MSSITSSFAEKLPSPDLSRPQTTRSPIPAIHNQDTQDPNNTSSTSTDPPSNDNKWVGHLPFPLDKGAIGSLVSVDICLLVGKSLTSLGWPKARAPVECQRPHRYYFDTKEYPPPPVAHDGRLCKDGVKIFEKIKLALEVAAHQSGCPILCNGSSASSCRDKLFCCGFNHRRYKDRRKPEADEIGPNGKKKQKRNKPSKLAKDGEATCRFRFAIAWDEIGFYLKQTIGCHQHTGHPKVAPEDVKMPSRLLPSEPAHEWFKDDYKETCNLLDNVRNVDPVKAAKLFAEIKEIFATLKDKCRAIPGVSDETGNSANAMAGAPDTTTNSSQLARRKRLKHS